MGKQCANEEKTQQTTRQNYRSKKRKKKNLFVTDQYGSIIKNPPPHDCGTVTDSSSGNTDWCGERAYYHSFPLSLSYSLSFSLSLAISFPLPLILSLFLPEQGAPSLFLFLPFSYTLHIFAVYLQMTTTTTSSSSPPPSSSSSSS